MCLLYVYVYRERDVCMYTCIYIYTHTCMYIYIYTHIYIYICYTRDLSARKSAAADGRRASRHPGLYYSIP